MWNNSKEKVLIAAWENKLRKLQISQNEILHMTIFPVFSQILWKLKFIFLGSLQEIVFGVITDN